MTLSRVQLGALVVTAAVVVAGKQFYRGASPDELQGLLAPVAKLVGWIVGSPFTYDRTLGWVNRDARFVIAPVCAGLNFALAAFLALSLGWLPAMRRPRDAAARLAGAAVVAYAATIVVDAARIALALETRADGAAHEALGVAVYLGALCALYAIAVRRRSDHVATA
ncbi:MAG TPA: exosortase K [Kofleriaceae bacterium]|nr:exosortase K [Kofleriaceae bacterium]